MDDQVRVAADRRGEMGVGGAAEPGVAAVSLAVGGLFEGTKHERCIRLAAVPAPRGLACRQAARLRRDLARLARREALAQRRRRHAERVQLGDQALDPGRVGLGVDAVERRHALALQELGDLFVGEDHQPLDQPVGLGLGHGVGAGHVARGVEAELGLGGLDVEAGRAAPLSQRRGDLARHRQRRGDRLGRPGATGEDRVELVVVEAGVGADAAAIEARRSRLAVRAQLDLGGDGEALAPRAPGCRRRCSGHEATSARPPPGRRCCWRGAAPPGRAASRGAHGRRRRRYGPRPAPRPPRAGPRRRRRSRGRWRGRR